MAQPTRQRVLNHIERDIEAEFNTKPTVVSDSESLLPNVSPTTPAIPPYVMHRDGATEIGKLSAEAVVREFEAAAQEVETVRAQLIERVRKCEAMAKDASTVTKELSAVAARYREEAKRIFDEIEDCSKVTAEARQTCTKLLDNIADSERRISRKRK